MAFFELYYAIACSAPRKSERSARHTHRMSRRTATTNPVAIPPATYGCAVANQVSDTASASSPRLRPIFERGSGDGVIGCPGGDFAPVRGEGDQSA